MTLDIRGFVERALELMANGSEFSDGDLEAAAIKHGLFDERPATAEDCETDWGQEHDVEVGDPITSRSDALKAWLEEKS